MRGGQAAEDLGVAQCLARRLGGLDLRRERVVEVGRDDVVGLQEPRRRQHVVGVGRGVREEEIADDGQQVLALQRGTQRRLLGAGGDRVDVPAHERAAALAVGEHVREIHLADRVRRIGPRQLRAREPAGVHAARVAAVEVQEARPRAADVAGQRRKRRDGAHDVAAARLALQALAHPEQRRPAAVDARDVLDQARRHAGALLRPRRACTARAAARARRSRARSRARRPRRRAPRGGSRAPARTRARRRCRGGAGGRCRPSPPWACGSGRSRRPRPSPRAASGRARAARLRTGSRPRRRCRPPPRRPRGRSPPRSSRRRS